MAVIADVSYDLNAGKSADVDAAVAAAAGLRLVGWVARSTAGATLEIVHGATADGGAAVVPIELPATGMSSGWLAEGIPMPNGISINRSAGTFDCTLFYKVLP
jgi:hypothetical protein